MELLSVIAAQRGALGVRDAVGWTIRLAKRVAALHGAGVVHGRISALAIRVGGATCSAAGSLADPSRALDVAAYRSPERRATAPGTVGDDVWATAVTLYLALTGELPFPGESYEEVEWKCLAAPPTPLRQRGVDDAALQRIIDRAFAIDLAERTVTMAALVEDLEAWPPGAALAALPPLDPDDGLELELDADEKTAVRTDVSAVLRELAARPAAPPPPPPSSRRGPASRRAPASQRPPVSRPPPMSHIIAMAARAPSSVRPPPEPAPEVTRPPAEPAPEPPPQPLLPPREEKEPDSTGPEVSEIAVPAPSAAPRAPRAAWTTVALGLSGLTAVVVAVILLVRATRGEPADEPASAPAAPASVAPAGAPPSQSAPPPPASPPSDDACMRQLFAPDTFQGDLPPVAPICAETDPRRGGAALRVLVVRAGSKRVSEGMKEWAVLGWYDMAAFAVVRGRCCASPPPMALPAMPEGCDALAGVLDDLGAAVAAGAEAKASAVVDRYTTAVRCIARGGAASVFGRAAPPQGGEATAFAKTLARGLAGRGP